MLSAMAGRRSLETGKHSGWVPGFALYDQTQQTRDFSLLFDVGVRMVFFLIIPAIAGIIALNRPIVFLLFGRGAFDLTAVDQTGQCLVFMVLGLWAVAGTRLFVAFHYALYNIRLPFMAGVVSIGCNFLLCRFFVESMGVTGLSLAVSVSAVAGFVLLAVSGPFGYPRQGFIGLRLQSSFHVCYNVFSCSMDMGLSGLTVQGSFRQQALFSVSVQGPAATWVAARLTSNPEMAMLTRIFLRQK